MRNRWKGLENHNAGCDPSLVNEIGLTKLLDNRRFLYSHEDKKYRDQKSGRSALVQQLITPDYAPSRNCN